MPKIILVCDDEDYRDIQREIAHQQSRAHQQRLSDGSPSYPDGTSNVAALCLGEACRALGEYRAMYDAERSEGE